MGIGQIERLILDSAIQQTVELTNVEQTLLEQSGAGRSLYKYLNCLAYLSHWL
jgi:hypothetical protein